MGNICSQRGAIFLLLAFRADYFAKGTEKFFDKVISLESVSNPLHCNKWKSLDKSTHTHTHTHTCTDTGMKICPLKTEILPLQHEHTISDFRWMITSSLEITSFKVFISLLKRSSLLKERIFSNLCLFEIHYLPIWETSISYDYADTRNNPLKVGRKIIKNNPSWASPCRIGNSPPWGMNFNQGFGKSRCWLKFLPRGWDFPILHGHSWWILIFSFFYLAFVSVSKQSFSHNVTVSECGRELNAYF